MQDPEQFIISVLKETFPDLDTRPGTGIRDTLIRPLTGVVGRLLHNIEELDKNSDLTNYKKMAPDIMDQRVSNWFVGRKTGQKSGGIVRITMDEPVAITINEGHRFTHGSNGLTFRSIVNVALDQNDSRYIKVVNGSSTVWQLNVPVEAIEPGLRYNVEPNVFVDFDFIDSHVVLVENIEPFTNGVDPENNIALFERLRNAITVRNLINPRSVKTLMLNNETLNIQDLVVAGMGSPEQQRDVISVLSGETFHIGGRADVYVKTPVVTRVKKRKVFSEGILKIVFDNEDIPVYRIRSIEYDTDKKISPDEIPAVETTTDHLLRFSKRENPFIRVNLPAGTVVNVTFDTADITAATAFTESDERVIVADVMARAPALVYVYMDVRYRLNSGSEPIDEAKLRSDISSYIDNLELGKSPEVSDIDLLAREAFDQIDRIVLPVTMFGALVNFTNKYHDKQSNELFPGHTLITSQDKLSVEEDVLHSLSVRTVTYKTGRITVSEFKGVRPESEPCKVDFGPGLHLMNRVCPITLDSGKNMSMFVTMEGFRG